MYQEGTTVSTADAEAVAEKFYNNSVFVGDSIMAGFAGYASSSEAPEFLKKAVFLASVSYGVGDALKPAGNGVVHPMYKGVSQPVTTSIAEIKPERIFINLGINELNGVSAERVGKKYGQLIEKIKEASPNSKIYVISLTYIVNGKEKEHFTNAGIKVYNQYLESHCKEWGATYLDLASKMTKDGNSLPAEYSSDSYVHHNKAGYALWVQFLKIQLLNISINKIKENNQGRIYREKLFAILVCGLMITVSGCGSNKSDNETTQSSQNVESKSVKDIYASVSAMAEENLQNLTHSIFLITME